MQVIYGDTDSIMVYTGSDNLAEVMKVGQAIKKEVRGKSVQCAPPVLMCNTLQNASGVLIWACDSVILQLFVDCTNISFVDICPQQTFNTSL